MAISSKPMSADQLMALPDDGQRHELVRGELRTMAPPGEEHGWLQGSLLSSLRGHVQVHGLGRVYGEVGFLLENEPDTVRAPDVAFVRQQRLDAAPQPGFWRGAPDLVV